MSAEEVARIVEAVSDWWFDQAKTEIDVAVPKAALYGSNDLAEIGRVMASIADPNGPHLTDEEATEVGIFFYAQGKLARWTAALRAGRRVDDDTLLDLGIYIKMAQRNRAVGGWPYGPDPDSGPSDDLGPLAKGEIERAGE